METVLNTEKNRYRLNRSETIYLFGCFLVYLLWAILFTGNRYGPDEVNRELVPMYILFNDRLPTGFEEAVRIEYWGFSYAYFMSVPYLTSAFFMKLMHLITPAVIPLRIACRLSSVFSGVGIGFFSIKITKRISDSPLRWVFIVLMTLLPQIIFLSSYFNLDTFSLFTVMIILLAWITGIQTGWGIKSCITLAVGMGLCFLSYKFAWPYILCSFLIYVTWHAVNRKGSCFKGFFLKGLLILGITFAICGWVFIRNAVLYDGDFLALKQNDIYGELYAIDSLKPSVRDTFKSRGESIGDMLRNSAWLKITARSFICGLGYLDIFPGWPYFYRLYDVLGIASAIGLVCYPFLRKPEDTKSKRKAVYWAFPFILLASAITFCISVYYSWSTDYQPQGRYIICALPLFAAFVSCGLWRLVKTAEMILSLIFKHAEKNRLPQLASAGACLWVAISAFIAFTTLVGHFLYSIA